MKNRWRIVERFICPDEIRFRVETRRGDGTWVKVTHRYTLELAKKALNEERSRHKPHDKVVYEE